jgi:hypothetical protein
MSLGETMELVEDTIVKRKVYIAGPMRGKRNKNREAFQRAEDHLLRQRIWEPVNPIKLDEVNEMLYDTTADVAIIRKIIKRDIDELYKCSSIYMLRGWEKSSGARAEHAFAVAISLPIMYQ